MIGDPTNNTMSIEHQIGRPEKRLPDRDAKELPEVQPEEDQRDEHSPSSQVNVDPAFVDFSHAVGQDGKTTVTRETES